MSRVAVTTEAGDHAGHFDWGKAARWSDRDAISGNGSGGAGAGEAVMLTAGGKWVLERWTDWLGQRNSYQWITPGEAQAWLIRNGDNDAVEEHFGDEPEEINVGGRPAIGGEALVRLGELLPAIDAYAARAGFSRAAAVRMLAGYGLVVASLPVGMKPIVIECDVVTGRIEMDDASWADGDTRWAFIADPFGSGANVMGTEVEPWGEDEFGMERATKAVRALGYTIGEWEGEPGGTWRATVTGRA